MWPYDLSYDLPCGHMSYLWPYDLSWPITWPHDLSCDQPCNHMKFHVTYHNPYDLSYYIPCDYVTYTMWPIMWPFDLICEHNTYNMTFYVIIWITMMTYQYQRNDDHVYENIPHKEEDDHRIHSCGESCSGGWRLLDPEHSPLLVLWLSSSGRTSLTSTSDTEPSFSEGKKIFSIIDDSFK